MTVTVVMRGALRDQADAVLEFWLRASLQAAYNGPRLEPIPADLLSLCCGEPARPTGEAA